MHGDVPPCPGWVVSGRPSVRPSGLTLPPRQQLRVAAWESGWGGLARGMLAAGPGPPLRCMQGLRVGAQAQSRTAGWAVGSSSHAPGKVQPGRILRPCCMPGAQRGDGPASLLQLPLS